MGEEIPTDPEKIGAAFGLGWWKQDTEAVSLDNGVQRTLRSRAIKIIC
jgi:hypothetical protein